MNTSRQLRHQVAQSRRRIADVLTARECAYPHQYTGVPLYGWPRLALRGGRKVVLELRPYRRRPYVYRSPGHGKSWT